MRIVYIAWFKGVTGLMRRQRDHEPRRTPHHLSPHHPNPHHPNPHHLTPHHLNPASQPGAVTARGFPNTLIQTERGRRHLPAATSGKKVKRRPRAGSFSLISNNNPSAPLQISRARRQVKTDPQKRGKSGRSGAYSVLGDPHTEGQTDGV
ncbi:unnamed protein product [Boreogadus saida]